MKSVRSVQHQALESSTRAMAAEARYPILILDDPFPCTGALSFCGVRCLSDWNMKVNAALLYRPRGRWLFWIAFASAAAMHVGAIFIANGKPNKIAMEN